MAESKDATKSGALIPVYRPKNISAKIIEQTTIQDVLVTRPDIGRPVVSLEATADLDKTLRMLQHANISSVPVVDSKHACLGFVDQLDIARFILASSPQQPKEKDLTELVYGTGQLSATPVANIINMSHRDPLVPIFEKHNALSGAEELSKGLHRVAVFNEKHELVAVLSQSDIVRYLNTKLQFPPEKMNLEEIAAMRDSPVRNLGLGERVIWTGHVPAVLQLRSDALVLDAIRKLAMTGAAALAIVDPLSGKLIGNFSAADLRGTARENAKQRTMDLYFHNVHSYLQKHHPSSLNPIADSRSHITFGQTLESMDKNRIHHLWMINKEGQPTGLISQTDVMRCIVKLPPSAYGYTETGTPLSQFTSSSQQQQQKGQQGGAQQQQPGQGEQQKQSQKKTSATGPEI